MATREGATPEKSATPKSSEVDSGKLGNSKEVDLDRSGVNPSGPQKNASTDSGADEGLELDSEGDSESDTDSTVYNERVKKDLDSGNSASV